MEWRSKLSFLLFLLVSGGCTPTHDHEPLPATSLRLPQSSLPLEQVSSKNWIVIKVQHWELPNGRKYVDFWVNGESLYMTEVGCPPNDDQARKRYRDFVSRLQQNIRENSQLPILFQMETTEEFALLRTVMRVVRPALNSASVFYLQLMDLDGNWGCLPIVL